MLGRIINLLSGARDDGADEQLRQSEIAQAAAALLVHAARIDGISTADEEAKLRELLTARFNLSGPQLAELLSAADEAEREAVDLYRFTKVLTRHLDQNGRKNIVEMLWNVAAADGIIHEFEANLVWRVAELIGVSTRDRVLLKQKALREDQGA